MLKNQEKMIAAETELSKFFTLLKENNYELMKMPRCIVDNYWHMLLKNPDEYNEFCVRYAGSHIDHVKNSGFGKIDWFNDYEDKYGRLTKEWFTNEEGVVDVEKYAEYLNSGEVKMQWDCIPIITTP